MIPLGEAIRRLASVEKTLLGADLEDVRAVLAYLRAQKAPRGFRRAFAVQVMVVEGRGRFPLEQAQRDQCTALTETDALRMGERLETRRIGLAWFVTMASAVPNHRRWLSFGWRVTWYGTSEDFSMKRGEILGGWA